MIASSLLLVATPTLPANNVRELAALARARPGGLNYGMTGVGNPLHLTLADRLTRSRHANPACSPANALPRVRVTHSHRSALVCTKIQAGLDIVAVPYKGDAPLNAALVAGEVDDLF